MVGVPLLNSNTTPRPLLSSIPRPDWLTRCRLFVGVTGLLLETVNGTKVAVLSHAFPFHPSPLIPIPGCCVSDCTTTVTVLSGR